MKKLLVIVMSLVLMILVVGCDGNTSSNATPEEIMNGVIEKIEGLLRDQGYGDEDFEEEALPGYSIVDFTNKDDIDFFPYDGVLDLDKIEGGFIISSNSMLNADQIVVIKVSDSSYLATIKAHFEENKESQAELFESYSPSQFEKIQNTIIEIHGDFIFYITFENAEDIEAVILNIIK